MKAAKQFEPKYRLIRVSLRANVSLALQHCKGAPGNLGGPRSLACGLAGGEGGAGEQEQQQEAEQAAAQAQEAKPL